MSLEHSCAHQHKPPQWIAKLGHLISQGFHSSGTLAPIGCHFHQNDELEGSQWEVTLFVSSTEFFGGPNDGKVAVSRFMLDLKEVLLAFDVVDSVYWQTHMMAEDDQVGPHIGVEGDFEGNAVWLRITAEPPAQFQPGRSVDLCVNAAKDRW